MLRASNASNSRGSSTPKPTRSPSSRGGPSTPSSSARDNGKRPSSRYTGGSSNKRPARGRGHHDGDDEENIDPAEAAAGMVEATTQAAFASSIPEAADGFMEAVKSNEWDADLLAAILVRLGAHAGLALIDPDLLGKSQAESGDSTKKGFKSAAFHAIVPLLGWFTKNNMCLATTSCVDDPVLNLSYHLWSGWGPAGITVAEFNKSASSFLKSIKSETWRSVREGLSDNYIGALRKIWFANQDDDGTPGMALTSGHIAQTLSEQLGNQTEPAMIALGKRMFVKWFHSAKHTLPASAGEKIILRPYEDVYGCESTAPYYQVLMTVNAVFIEELELFIAADVIKARRATPGHVSGNKSDPDSYDTFQTCKQFIERMFSGKESGADADRSAIIRNKFWAEFLRFSEEYLGMVPNTADVTTFEDAQRYLYPYLFVDEDEVEGEDGGEGKSPDGDGGEGEAPAGEPGAVSEDAVSDDAYTGSG